MCDVKPQGVVTIVNVMAHLVQVYPNHFPQVIAEFLTTVIKNLLKEEVCRCVIFLGCIIENSVSIKYGESVF